MMYAAVEQSEKSEVDTPESVPEASPAPVSKWRSCPWQFVAFLLFVIAALVTLLATLPGREKIVLVEAGRVVDNYWRDYALGDVVRYSAKSRKFRLPEYVYQYPNSIAAIYREGGSDYDLHRLAHAVKEYARPSNKTLVVHARIGDILVTKEPDPWKAPNHRYAYGKAYYDRLRLPHHFKEVVIVASAVHHEDEASRKASMQYVYKLINYFKKRLNVPVRLRGLHNTPDDDFAYLTRARALVPGGGGYSKLAECVARMHGATIFANANRQYGDLC